MDIGEILSRAWQIVWRHKVLWIFGILAGCGSTSGSSGNIRYDMNQGDVPPQMQRFFDQIDPTVLIILGILAVLIILLLVVVSVFLSTMGRIGIIQGTHQVEQGTQVLTFGGLFSGSLPYFWRVFALNLLVGLAITLVVVAIVLIGGVGSALTLGIGLLCFIPLMCLIIPVIWLVNLIIQFADNAIVVEGLSIMDALRRGWDVVRANLGNVIVMALILGLGISGIGGFLISLPVFAIAGPAVVGLITGDQTFATGGIVTSIVLFLLYLPLLLVLSGLLRSYVDSAWTLTYRRLTGKQPTAITL